LPGGPQSALPLIAKPAIDEIFFKKDIAALQWIPLAVVAIFLFRGLANYGQAVLMVPSGLRIITDLRNKLYEQIQKQSLSFFAEHPTGLLMSRITELDVNPFKRFGGGNNSTSQRQCYADFISRGYFLHRLETRAHRAGCFSPEPSILLLFLAEKCAR